VNGKVEDSAQYLQRMSNGDGLSNGNGMANVHAQVTAEDLHEEVSVNQLALPETGVKAAGPSTSLFDICSNAAQQVLLTKKVARNAMPVGTLSVKPQDSVHHAELSGCR